MGYLFGYSVGSAHCPRSQIQAAIGVKNKAGTARGGTTTAVMSKPIAVFPEISKMSSDLSFFIV